GHAGPAGAGDALVTVQLVPHPQFKVDEADLTLEIPISLDEAVLGGKLTVPTLEGPVSMTLPKRADVTKAFRLRGKGLWRSESERGDLFVRAVIVLPPEGDDALDALMKRWRADKRHTPR
ncbi:MAG: J domain-containing protein, partial [Hyphomicrobiaceae bacterium]|nr:J domain-containing protein [Hyphomicrobiaceae bacterium]